MTFWPDFLGSLSFLVPGAALFGFARLFGWAVDYRGILWRKPPGYVSQSPFKQGLLTRYPADGFFFRLARLYALVFEGVSLVIIAIGLLGAIGSLLSLAV